MITGTNKTSPEPVTCSANRYDGAASVPCAKRGAHIRISSMHGGLPEGELVEQQPYWKVFRNAFE